MSLTLVGPQPTMPLSRDRTDVSDLLGEVEETTLVSVVIAFFNASQFLRDAVESVVAQTFTNWELLLVDDGSTDGSGPIALQYVQTDPSRIRYLIHPGGVNRGTSASRNLGVSEAKGEFVAFLDADDQWFPQKLSEQVEIAIRHPEVGMVTGATEYWSDCDQPIHRPVTVHLGVPAPQIYAPPVLALALHPLGRHPAPCPSDLFLRRAAVAGAGGFDEAFTQDLQLYEDQVFLAKIYLTQRVYVGSNTWSRYRQHPNSCMARVKQQGKVEAVRLHFLDWYQQYARGFTQFPDLGRSIRRARRETRYPRVAKFGHWLYSVATLNNKFGRV